MSVPGRARRNVFLLLPVGRTLCPTARRPARGERRHRRQCPGSSWIAVFREVGRVIGTVQLLRHLADAPLCRRVAAVTNKVEAFNGFSQRIGFGNGGVITDNDPVEQGKTEKFNSLLTSGVIFHNALDIAEIVRRLQE
ncbi:Tn3 family transposase [Streptomyces sp. NBC_00878]|uniref:Tn3 family transposase n=1 Tax=Streptomyces sp. NBC_00878 TaxID=2975854 RepID=UPI00224EF681|nr:Tn3 family transposase [Streptomyces sp. NBC_00878]MCX4907703.1 transposase [Streptomyces sp. NBC_00878]